MSRSPWFPKVTGKNTNTSSPWFTETYRMTSKVVKNSTSKTKRGGKKDLDGDGVPNWKDCQPKNTMRQDKVMNIAVSGMSRLFTNVEKPQTVKPQEPVKPEEPKQ